MQYYYDKDVKMLLFKVFNSALFIEVSIRNNKLEASLVYETGESFRCLTNIHVG